MEVSTSAALMPWHDCPSCPKCGMNCSVPASQAGTEGRWYGPPEATLFCPACGAGWVGDEADVAQAVRAQLAWEQHEGAPAAI